MRKRNVADSCILSRPGNTLYQNPSPEYISGTAYKPIWYSETSWTETMTPLHGLTVIIMGFDNYCPHMVDTCDHVRSRQMELVKAFLLGSIT